MKNVTNNDVGGSFRNPNAVLSDFFEDSFFTESYAFFDEAALPTYNKEQCCT